MNLNPNELLAVAEGIKQGKLTAAQQKKTVGAFLEGTIPELARSEYWAYVFYTNRGLWKPGKVHVFLCDQVQKFIETETGHPYDILLIHMPPQFGKSTTITEALPSWIMCKNPDYKGMLISYTDDVALRFTKSNKDKIDEFGMSLFNASFDKDLDRADEYRLAGSHGYAISRGIGGSITSYTANWMVIDDPVKSSAQADSELNRQRANLEWNMTLRTRLMPGAKVIVIMCMPGDTRVMMADGSWKNLASIRPGEMVQAWNNGQIESRAVTAFLPQGRAPIYEVKMRNNTFRATGNHPVLVATDNGTEWRRTDALNIGDNVVVLGRSDGGYTVPDDVSLEDVWALGFMYGDGWITRHPNSAGSMRWVTCVAKSIYPELNNRILNWFSERWKQPKETKYGYYRTEVASAGRYLERLGFLGNAKTKRIPQWVYQAPLEYREAFVIGFNDADGCVDKHGRANVRSVNADLMHDLKLLAMSCGYRTSNITKQTRTYQPPHSKKPILASSYHFSFSLTNKNDAPFTVSKVRSVELVGTDEVYDLTVEGDHNFIAEGVVVHNTRWHELDLGGYIQQTEDPSCVRVINLPCEAEENDPLGRRVGEALAPEIGRGDEWLAQFKKGFMTAEGTRAWTAMYQCRPTSLEGNLIKRDWWQKYRVNKRPAMIQQLISVDAAFKDGKKNDFVSIQMWGKRGADFYLVDRDKRRMDFPSTLDAIRGMVRRHKHRGIVLIEDKANGSAIISVLKREIPGIIPVNPEGGKVARVNAVSPAIESGNVWLPHEDDCPWIIDFIEECASFPNGKNDDDVDAMSQALNRFLYFDATIPLTDEEDEEDERYGSYDGFINFGT